MPEKVQIQIMGPVDNVGCAYNWVTVGIVEYDNEDDFAYLKNKAQEIVKEKGFHMHKGANNMCRAVFPSGFKVIITDL